MAWIEDMYTCIQKNLSIDPLQLSIMLANIVNLLLTQHEMNGVCLYPLSAVRIISNDSQSNPNFIII